MHTFTSPSNESEPQQLYVNNKNNISKCDCGQEAARRGSSVANSILKKIHVSLNTPEEVQNEVNMGRIVVFLILLHLPLLSEATLQ